MPAVSVRDIVEDVDEAIAFYAGVLGFAVDLHPAPAFAVISRGAHAVDNGATAVNLIG